MSTLDIIDSHFHQWNLEKQTLPWLESEPAALKRSFSVHELMRQYEQIDDVRLVGLVHIEADCEDPHEEHQLVRRLKTCVPAFGIVSRAKLSAEMDILADSNGVREVLHTPSAKPGRCLEESFLAGLELLSNHGLPFDAVVRPQEIPHIAKASRLVPDASIILNHVGNIATLSSENMQNLREFANTPNTFCKLSGIPVDQPDLAQEILQFVKNTFGTDRLLFASNWPVGGVREAITQQVQLVRNVFGDDPAVFKNNASAIYRLGV
ncbi:amidohydrolase family protein [Corynebacterium imitans]|uniref:amidohydrolase family protein n=1 Tax=Corynebacterium imitans TaxID=156978 RepID=UPI00254BCC4C|nr:amidohydrolase family protein [Corynebacterium imitans]MDK8305462.1 amidohydrolase family protein [Corynebacterium imitans]MDK8636237.1 amidohydrolase family protein [Corynebacterium imitans]MDK8771435.1 amidohydrolase family protein [Corynebacterium imitans]